MIVVVVQIYTYRYQDPSRMVAAANVLCHYENTPIQIYRKFHLQKLKIFR